MAALTSSLYDFLVSKEPTEESMDPRSGSRQPMAAPDLSDPDEPAGFATAPSKMNRLVAFGAHLLLSLEALGVLTGGSTLQAVGQRAGADSSEANVYVLSRSVCTC